MDRKGGFVAQNGFGDYQKLLDENTTQVRSDLRRTMSKQAITQRHKGFTWKSLLGKSTVRRKNHRGGEED